MKKLKTQPSPSPESRKLFGLDFERLTRTHTYVPVSVLTAFSLGCLLWGSLMTPLAWYQQASLFFAGLLVFTLIEYLIHRYAYHLPVTSERGKQFQYIAHGLHHDQPRDTHHLAMPPLLSGLLSALLLWGTYAALGPWAFGLSSGITLGYAAYLLVHYIVHAYAPPKNRFKYLWQHHAIHHYHDDSVAYGVSSPFWDVIFGTMPKGKKASGKG